MPRARRSQGAFDYQMLHGVPLCASTSARRCLANQRSQVAQWPSSSSPSTSSRGPAAHSGKEAILQATEMRQLMHGLWRAACGWGGAIGLPTGRLRSAAT